MFRIRKVPDDSTPGNAEALRQVQAIWRARFPLVAEEDIASLPEKLRDPLKYRFRSVLLVAEDARHRVQGFALLLHAPDLNFCYLDFIAIALDRPGRGIGGALYERVREETLALGAAGVFLECLPDDPALSPDPELRAENAERLKFYERYGARPIADTKYETP
ncbi:MAG: GNAT family N-acetyltransferase, partial [Chromatiaceae bacterium]|nr:GNAT family N-acetyltransferase [Chromatiaceae bacterium]